MGTLDWGWSLSGSHGSGAQAQQADTSGSAILAALLGGGGGNATAQSTDTTNPQQTATATNPSAAANNPTAIVTNTGTGNSGTQYGNAPNSRDHWQNGQGNPNGQTQNPQTGRQTGGRYVDPTYQTDATGRQLTPDEQKAWRQYDVDRANASTAEQARYDAYKANQATTAGADGQKAVFDARTKTWSLYDPTAKTWKDGIGQNDIYSQLTGNLKQENPEWWWGDTANSAIDQAQYQNLRYANQYQSTQSGNRQQTRYSTYGM